MTEAVRPDPGRRTFVHERVQVAARPAFVRAHIVSGVHDGGLVTAAGKALSEGPNRVPRAVPFEATPVVKLQAQVITRPETTVVAMRAFTAAESAENQPTLDVNLEIKGAGDGTALVLTGVIRPFRHPTDSAAWHDKDYRGVGQRFLEEMVASVTAATTSERQDTGAGPTGSSSSMD